jgi:hypothetical protein
MDDQIQLINGERCDSLFGGKVCADVLNLGRQITSIPLVKHEQVRISQIYRERVSTKIFQDGTRSNRHCDLLLEARKLVELLEEMGEDFYSSPKRLLLAVGQSQWSW